MEKLEVKELIPTELCLGCEHNTWKNQTWCDFHKSGQSELIYCGFKGVKIMKEIHYIEEPQFFNLVKDNKIQGKLNGSKFIIIEKTDKDLWVCKYDAIYKYSIHLINNKIKSVKVEMRKSKDNNDYFVDLTFYSSLKENHFKRVLRC